MVCSAVLIQLCKVCDKQTNKQTHKQTNKQKIHSFFPSFFSFFLFLSLSLYPQSSPQVPSILAECIDRVFYDVRLMDRGMFFFCFVLLIYLFLFFFSSKKSFKNKQTKKIECVDRFTEWFALHLSNFQFQWNWQSWDYVLEENRSVEHGKNKPFQLSFMRQVRGFIKFLSPNFSPLLTFLPYLLPASLSSLPPPPLSFSGCHSTSPSFLPGKNHRNTPGRFSFSSSFFFSFFSSSFFFFFFHWTSL